MLCEQFLQMTTKERIEFIGKLNHAVMNDVGCFEAAAVLLNFAESKKLFDDVVINPPRQVPEKY